MQLYHLVLLALPIFILVYLQHTFNYIECNPKLERAGLPVYAAIIQCALVTSVVFPALVIATEEQDGITTAGYWFLYGGGVILGGCTFLMLMIYYGVRVVE